MQFPWRYLHRKNPSRQPSLAHSRRPRSQIAEQASGYIGVNGAKVRGGDAGVRCLTQPGGTCGQASRAKEPGERALSARCDPPRATTTPDIPQPCAGHGTWLASRRNLDFRDDCLVRDAVRSEPCSSLFLRDFPVFEQIIGK